MHMIHTMHQERDCGGAARRLGPGAAQTQAHVANQYVVLGFNSQLW
jgi:hypothetical protein